MLCFCQRPFYYPFLTILQASGSQNYMYFLSKCCCCFRTYYRCTPHKITPCSTLYHSWLKLIPQKCKGYLNVILPFITTLAKHYLLFSGCISNPQNCIRFFSISSMYSAYSFDRHRHTFPTCT